jgi:coproporphyrinogen III oxidase
MQSFKKEFVTFLRNLQDSICQTIEQEDTSGIFKEEKWERPEGGGGRTRIISEGAVFEKGGVNTSEVSGILPPSMMDYLNVENNEFFACGLSLVLHPKNPNVPTVHANYRYFELYDSEGNIIDHWFGGGSDLTPYYLIDEDVIHFHQILKNESDRFDKTYYSKYKRACDNYFYNHHRKEARGIGGLFYDYLRSNKKEPNHWFNFVTAQAGIFLESYIPIVKKNKNIAFSNNEKKWQEIRRGRYVEFNLIHDKGTLFGLKTNGRIESIFMSLPPTVRWDYNHSPQVGSREYELLNVLKNPKDWI